MKIFISLTYYRPHVSGLTIYVERLARALAARQHSVTVLTSQYDSRLPRRERRDGVEILRVPVMLRVSKGVIMPLLGWYATQLAKTHDVISLHLPQFDASGIAARGPLLNRPVVLTYHSDLLLPPSLMNLAAGSLVNLSNHIAAWLADVMVAYTDDFARHSPYLSRYLHKVRVIPPPVEIPAPAPAAIDAFRAKHRLDRRGPVIGLAVRLAAEKGVEYLLEALPRIMERCPDVCVLHAGPREAIGEEAYARRLAPLIERLQDRYVFLGTLNPAEMAVFFSCCDVHVLPSINNTETFGLVQIEAALCGTPSVATALPGVRMPTRMTGMGVTVPPRDAAALAEAVCEVLANRAKYVRPREPIAAQFSPAAAAECYEQIFMELLERRR